MKNLLCALLLVCTVQAANFYVSPTGNDANPGTAAAPWKTIKHGIDSISKGCNAGVWVNNAYWDTLYLADGTYNESNCNFYSKKGIVLASQSKDRSKVILTSGNGYLITAAGNYKMGHIAFHRVTVKDCQRIVNAPNKVSNDTLLINVKFDRSIIKGGIIGVYGGKTLEIKDSCIVDSVNTIADDVQEVAIYKSELTRIRTGLTVTMGTWKNQTTEMSPRYQIEDSKVKGFTFELTNGVNTSPLPNLTMYRTQIDSSTGTLFSNTLIRTMEDVTIRNCENVFGSTSMELLGGAAFETESPIEKLNVYDCKTLVDYACSLSFAYSTFKGNIFWDTEANPLDQSYIIAKNCTFIAEDSKPALRAKKLVASHSIFHGKVASLDITADSSRFDTGQTAVGTGNVFGYTPQYINVAKGDSLQPWSYGNFKIIGSSWTGKTTNAKLLLKNGGARTYVRDEVIIDTLTYTNNGNGNPLFVPLLRDMIVSNPRMKVLSIIPAEMSYIQPGDSCRFIYTYTASATPASEKAIYSFESPHSFEAVGPYGPYLSQSLTRTDTLSLQFSDKNFTDQFPLSWIGGTISIGDSSHQSHWLKNSLTNTITLTRVYENANEIRNICFAGKKSSATVRPGDSVKVEFDYFPLVANQSYVANISFDTPNHSLGKFSSVQFSAVAADPLLNSNKELLDFENLPVDGTRDLDFVITNPNLYDITIDSISFNNSEFTEVGSIKGLKLPQGNQKTVVVKYTAKTEGASLGVATVHFAKMKTKQVSLKGTGIKTNVSFTPNSIMMKRTSLVGFRRDTIVIKNNGNYTITPSEPALSGVFQVASPMNPIPAGGTGYCIIQFTAPDNGKGGDFTHTFRISYHDGLGIKESGDLTVSALAVGAPTATIDSITPNNAVWDSNTVVLFAGKGMDTDVADSAKLGKEIQSYLWESSLNGALSSTAAGFGLKSSELKIGTHTISLRVVDNEGDTSTAVTKTLMIMGQTPYAKIKAITPRSVIIRDGEDVALSVSAYDRDEPATNEIVTVQWHSTISGALPGATEKLDSIKPSTLPLGLHGFYAVVTDNEGQISNSDTVWIPVQISMGHAIIVTGATFGESSYFINNISPNANMAYKRLTDRGFSNEQIFYMNPVGWQCIEGNGLINSNIVDNTTMTKAALHDHLVSIAGDIKKDIPLVIYFLGHGNANQQNAKFYINDNEYIDPATLNAWLNEFGDLSANKSYITIILDFCYSGGFVPGLTSTTQKRAVITSASAGTTAYFSRGKSFGTALFNEVYRGKSLKSCFETASLWSEQNAPGGAKANPTMNINQATADNIFLGGSQQLQGLIGEIETVTSSIYLGNVTMTAKLQGDISTVRCRMIPETFDPKNGSYADLPVTTFTRNSEDTTLWSGIVTYFPAVGNYLLMVEGEDAGANMILPQGIAVKIDNTGIKTMNKPAQLFFGTANIGGSTQLKFGLPETSPVTITIYDLRGRVVNQLVNSVLNAGYYNIPLDNLMGAGMYITRFTAGSKSMTEKVMIQR